jgi:hypothetical protein
MRRPPPLVPLALAAGVVAAAPPARADEAPTDETSTGRWSLRAELGPELDTNAHRTEVVNVPGVVNPPIVSSALARGVLGWSLSDTFGEGHEISMSATLAAKVFEREAARDEDVGIADSALSWRAPLGARTALLLGVAYYEAFQREAPAPVYGDDRRDFRSVTPTARLLGVAAEHVEVGVGAGYRFFTFKPDRSYDFQAPTGSLELRWARETADGAADWEAGLRAGYERRAFEGHPYVEPPGCSPPGTCPPITGAGTRLDHFVTGAFDLARTGRVLVGGGYALHVNLSNSFGETVTRHFVTARLAAALPLDVYVALHAELLFAQYREHVAVAQTDTARPFTTIEDENRSSGRVDLSRNLSERLQLLARYTIYFNQLGSGAVTYGNGTVSYLRQTALLNLVFSYEK